MANGQICRAQANTFLSTMFQNSFIGLSMTDPGVEGDGASEPSESAGYKRHQLTEMEAPKNGQIYNKEIIFMGETLESWGTITHFIISKTVNGPVIFHAPLNAPVTIPEGNVPIFRRGELIVGIDKDTLDTPTFD